MILASESRPIKPRARRSQADMDSLKQSIYDVLAEIQPATVRGTFYQLVSRGFIEKTESAYKNIVVRLLGDMRRTGDLPFEWLADNTRWMRKPTTYRSLSDMLDREQEFYRRALWSNQAHYVEIWLEKDALSGVLYEETAQWDVPLMVTRGYPSLTYLHAAGRAIAAQGKPAYLYYFGDFDPSGVDITRAVERDVRKFAGGAEIHFERCAVTEGQIRALNLPTRPTKATDSRAARFGGECVEVDAIAPARLREMVRIRIIEHIDENELDAQLTIQQMERETLARIATDVRAAL